MKEHFSLSEKPHEAEKRKKETNAKERAEQGSHRAEVHERLSPVIARAQEIVSRIETRAREALSAGREKKEEWSGRVREAARSAAFRVFDTVREYVRKRHPFDSKTEVKSLMKTPRWRLPYEITEFKKSLSEKQRALAKLREDIVRIVHEDPSVSPNFLKEYANQAISFSNLPEKQKLFAHYLIDIYAKNHKIIASFIERYPDIYDLFEAVFGRKPQGKIGVIEGPMTLYFRCHDIADYAYIRSCAFLTQRNVTAHDLFLAKMSGGVMLLKLRIPELAGLVMAENAFGPGGLDDAAGAILSHEEQHVMHHFFDTEARYHIREDLLNRAKTPQETKEAIARYLRSKRRQFEENAKDEILAYLVMRNALSPAEIFQELVTPASSSGLYDYMYYHESVVDALRDMVSDKYGGLVDAAAANVFRVDSEEYKKIIRKGIFAALELRDRGYSNEKIAALLGGEELRRWPRFVKRLLSVSLKSEPNG